MRYDDDSTSTLSKNVTGIILFAFVYNVLVYVKGNFTVLSAQ